MKGKISGFITNISDSLTNYKSVVDNVNWNGPASNTFYENATRND